MVRRRIPTVRVAPARGGNITGGWTTGIVVTLMAVAVWMAGRGGLLAPAAGTHRPAVHSTSHSAPRHH